jgi:DNA-3-methyladenine glycosylase II
MEDEVIIQALTTVRGIGRWSVEMMLMFHLGRPDVFAADDLGLQEGIKRLLDLSERPKRKGMPALAEAWRPYRSTASWYLWRLL